MARVRYIIYLLLKEMQHKRIIEMDEYCIFIASFNLNFLEGNGPFQVVLHWRQQLAYLAIAKPNRSASMSNSV